MKSKLAAWIVLGIITIVAAFSLAVTNEVTKAPIAEQAAIAEERARKAVMPEADVFDELVLPDGQTVFVAKAGEEILGYVGKTERSGYGGPVEIIAGVKADGTITGINVGGTNFSETPGLGAKAREEAFTAQFSGKQSPVRLGDSTASNGVDAITASTITSNAVVGGVNAIAKQIDEYLNPPVEVAEPAQGTTYAGEAEGFKSPVYVEVTVGDDGAITALKVGDERFNETEGYGSAALDKDFPAQFIGKMLPIKPGDVDGISGSTATTNAVLAAINTAFESKNSISSTGPVGTTYAGEAEGFKSPVYVEVTVGDDGAITALKVGDERFNETEGYGSAALEKDFPAQFIGKSLPVQPGDVDGISGSTATTNAVLAAINTAFESKNIIASSGPVTPQGTTYAGEADGFKSPVYVEVTVGDDGAITALKVGDERFNETAGYGDAALAKDFPSQFIGKKLPITKGDVDGISGSTFTTDAVLAAINTAYESKNIISQGTAPEQTEPAATEVPAATPVVAGDGITASKEGFMGPVAVTVVFNQDGSIASVSIGDDSFAETPGYGAKALEEAFTNQFIGKLPPLAIRVTGEAESQHTVENLVSIDTATSATKTMQAILDAINEAFSIKP